METGPDLPVVSHSLVPFPLAEPSRHGVVPGGFSAGQSNFEKTKGGLRGCPQRGGGTNLSQSQVSIGWHQEKGER